MDFNSLTHTQKISVLLPSLMEKLDITLAEFVGTKDFNIIVIVGCDGHSQYVANRVSREDARKVLQNLYQRWGIDLPDFKHDDELAKVSRAADFLLNKWRESFDSKDEFHNLSNLLQYIHHLETKAELTHVAQTGTASVPPVSDKSESREGDGEQPASEGNR